MSELSKQALKVDNNTSFPNNNSGLITPTILRTFNENMIDSLVDEIGYNVDSASWNQQIDALEQFTASVVGINTGSLLVTASANQNVITFTKGDASTFNVTIADTTNLGPLNQATESLQQFTSSANTRLNNLESTTASLNSSVSQLNANTASQQQSINSLNVATQSLQSQLATIGTQSGSWITESETASFARTNTTNSFTETQTFTNVVVTGTASVALLNVTIESSSVIYSSGSNQFGDAANDIQTLYGSTRVMNELTASGLRYPTADNGAKSFMQTDGAGTLSLQYVDTIWETIRAGENVAKGTPLYISGSQGANPIVYAADASNPAKMPVTFVAGQAYTANTTYPAIVLGLIEGMDLTGYTAGQTVYVAEGGGWTTNLPSGSNSITQVLGVVTKGGSGGKGLVLNPGPAQLPGLQTGYVWVGNGNNRAVSVATSSLVTNVDTGSLVTTASFNAYTSSNDQKVNSLISATGSYATTGSNSFNGNQIITGSVTISGSSTTDLTIVGQIFVSSSATGGTTQPRITVSGSAGQSIINRNNISTRNTTNVAQLNPSSVFMNSIATADEIGFSVDPAATPNWSLGPSMYVNNPGDTYPAVIGFQNKANYTDGRVAILTPLSASAGFTASLQTGYVWVGNVAGQNSQVATSSLQTNISNLATTGSNAFFGTNTFSGAVAFTGSAPTILSSSFSGSVITNLTDTYVDVPEVKQIVTLTSASYASLVTAGTVNPNTLYIVSGSTSTNIINTGSFATTGSNTFIGNQIISGNVDIQSTLTSSLQQGYVWVGNSAGRTTTVATSSFGGGGAAFPYTGSAQITGSLGVTGSVSGFVNPLTITSNTASMNFNDGNFFTLQLVKATTTHLDATNIKPGQTINLLVKMDSGSASDSGSLTFAPTFKFAGGFDYTPTAITASQDLVSFVTFDTTQIFAAQIKNLS